MTRHSHYVRIRLGGVSIWRIQCTPCKAVFTVLPPFVLRSRQMRPDVACNALLATPGGLSLERCAVMWPMAPMALSRRVCALGHQSMVAVLTRCGLPLPMDFLADETHSRCLAEKVSLPHARPWPRDLASGRHGERECGGLAPVLWRVSTRGAPAGAGLSRPGEPDRWLRQHHQCDKLPRNVSPFKTDGD